MSPAYESVFQAVNIIANKCGYVMKEDKRLKFNLLMPHPDFNNSMYNILLTDIFIYHMYITIINIY